MKWYGVLLSTLSLAYMLVLVALFIWKLITSKGQGEKLKFIKSFKFGKFAFIYVAAFPLFFIGNRFNGVSWAQSVFDAIKCSMELVVLRFNFDRFEPLTKQSELFTAVVGICYSLVIINAFIFVFALFAQRAYNRFKKKKIKYAVNKVYVVIGYNESSKTVIDSLRRDRREVLLMTDKKRQIEARDYGTIKGIAVVGLKPNEDVGEEIYHMIHKPETKTIKVIVNTENDETNLFLAESLKNAVVRAGVNTRSIVDDKGLDAYVFGKPDNASAFVYFVKESKGAIHYVNKYRLIAFDFEGRYPLTQFMTEKQLNYDDLTLRDDVEVNVAIIGFGDVNRGLFLASVASDRFLKEKDGKVVPYNVNYHIYDKDSADNNKNLNHDYFRYESLFEDFWEERDEYLPLPERPANVVMHKMNINERAFYNSLHNALTGGEDDEERGKKQCFNYIVIGYGTDLENLDFAEKVTAKVAEWNLEDTKVFVRIRNSRLSQGVIAEEYARRSGFIPFGNESSIVYDYKNITSEHFEAMAKDKHLCYALESLGEGSKETEEGVLKKASKQWYEDWSQVQRESNIYVCLSIREKLHLMGYDMAPMTSDDAVGDAEEFMKKYQEKDPIVLKKGGSRVQGKAVVDYGDCMFRQDTRRQRFAVQEHDRWNAYEICSGIIPATIREMEIDFKERNRAYTEAKRKHANITTFDGLLEFRRRKAQATGRSEADCDVIKYDYQLMDDIVWLLNRNGYKIVKREGGKQ